MLVPVLLAVQKNPPTQETALIDWAGWKHLLSDQSEFPYRDPRVRRFFPRPREYRGESAAEKEPAVLRPHETFHLVIRFGPLSAGNCIPCDPRPVLHSDFASEEDVYGWREQGNGERERKKEYS